MDLFIDAHQYKNAAAAGAAEARNKAAQVGARVTDLERRLDKLSLTCQALWEILKEKTHVTEIEVVAKMEEIDLRDGRKDGKISGRVMSCFKCGRNINSARPVCIYCGHENKGRHLVE